MVKTKYNILVLDMQPIDPPVGGGRLRLLGLYHKLGESLPTQYIGTYDWPGEKYRNHQLSDTLREIDIPLSDEHFTECKKRQEQVNGKTIIDVTFSQLAHLSPQYINYVRTEVVKADVVIFSHPWVYPLVKDLLKRGSQMIIYDSQNVEGYLRFTLLDDGGFGTEIVRNVVKTEYELCQFANVIFACSFEDCELFNKLYNVPFNKMKIVPNGVFTNKITPIDEAEKKKIKLQLGLGGRKTAIFIGSNYSPNLEACHFIINDLAPVLPEITFLIAGGVGEEIDKRISNEVKNIRITGFLSEKDKLMYLAASDIAINPMFSGSGTNIKMFDFMAAGLPIISTAIGARGITKNNFAGIIIEDNREGFLNSIREFINNLNNIDILGNKNRSLVLKNYSWEKISENLGDFLKFKLDKKLYSYQSHNKGSFALLSSWNLKCGIAEHSRYLSNQFQEKNIEFRIIANSNNDITSSDLVGDISKNIDRLWKYDYDKWVDTAIDISGIIQTMHSNKISKLNIQYHTGFFNQELLLILVKECIKENFELSIALHNRKEMDLNTLITLHDLGVKLITHSSIDSNFLVENGLTQVYNIPLGIHDYPDEDPFEIRNKFNITGSPVIGSFGFLRTHKGIYELIETINLLRSEYPNIKLLGINSLYPSKDSEQYFKTCLNLIDKLNLDSNITLITDFLEIESIIQYLHATDLIVLPYHENKEGSSASANTVISAKRPFLISNSEIFNEIKNLGHIMKDINPVTISVEIKKLLSESSNLDSMKNKIINHVDQWSYSKIADKYIDLILGEDNR